MRIWILASRPAGSSVELESNGGASSFRKRSKQFEGRRQTEMEKSSFSQCGFDFGVWETNTGSSLGRPRSKRNHSLTSSTSVAALITSVGFGRWIGPEQSPPKRLARGNRNATVCRGVFGKSDKASRLKSTLNHILRYVSKHSPPFRWTSVWRGDKAWPLAWR